MAVPMSPLDQKNEKPHDKLVRIAQSVVASAQALEAMFKEGNASADAVADDKSIHPADVAKAFFAIKAAHEALDAQTKILYHVKDFFDKKIMPERLETFSMDLIRVPELARSFSSQTKTSASLLDKDKGFAWLRGLGQGDIITETVNAGTLSAFVRNLQLEQGIDPPEDVVKVTKYNTTSVTKYTPKLGK